MDKTILHIKSKLDTTFDVFIIYKENERYPELSEFFNKFGHAFIVSGRKIIFVDGEFLNDKSINKNHLYAILAHEMSHYILKHSKSLNRKTEMEADVAGIQILRDKGFEAAAKLLEKRFKGQYSKTVDQFKLEDKKQEILNKYLAK